MLDKILPKAKQLIEETSPEGGRFIDATCGNGHDTKFLADLAGEKGHVYSFDIQQEAIESARQNTVQYKNITFINDSHANIDQYIDTMLNGAMFNLGYLPKGDKNITTQAESTIEALYKIFNQLEVGGRIVLVVYHGHPEGQIEKEALLSELSTWTQESAQVLEYRFINQKNHAPFIICIEKIKNAVL
jgi:16S rRNA C1402 N4-methylase RsmH